MSDTPSVPASPAANQAAVAPASGIFSYGGFKKLFFGSLLGVFADRLYFMALIAAANVVYFDGAPEEYKGQIQIYATIPLLLLYGVAGSLVDGFDRRRLLMLVKAVKAAGVLLFVPLLWDVCRLDPRAPDLELKKHLVGLWPWCLAIVVLLNAISVPFGPARAAAVPDVVPDEKRALGASLMATSGLMALLLAAGAGGYVARTDWLGPAWTTVAAAGFYVVSAVFFAALPDAVAVPGNKRAPLSADSGAKSGSAAVEDLGPKHYWLAQWQGVVYCLRHGSLIGLIFFETAFWTIGSAFYILMDFHARTAFGLQGNELTSFSGVALACAGVGLFSGAIGVGRICGRTSPIVTYTPSFLLLAAGLYAVFRAPGMPGGGAPDWIYPVMFCLGFGGGSLLGRVDADVLAVTDAPMRGRVFSIKALAFAATILATIVYLSEGRLTDPEKAAIALWMPRIFFTLIPLAFLFSWITDVAINAQKGTSEPPHGLHRLAYVAYRAVLWCIIRPLFRYEVIGSERIPKDGPVILAANHASFIDPILLGCCTQRVVQYTMHALYYRSFAHPVFRLLCCISVDEGSTLAALKANVRSLEKGACIGIFPEGRVSDTGELQPAKEGALFLAQRSGAPVVPVAIKGNSAVLPRGAWLPRLKKITILVGEPFRVPAELTREQIADMSHKMMVDLAAKLELKPPARSTGAN